MTLKYKIASALAFAGLCACDPVLNNEPATPEMDSYLFLTKAPGSALSENLTFRISDMYNSSPTDLCADGAYCSYMNTDKGWLYPCKVDDEGNALDAAGAVIDWDAPDWFERTVNDTKYALRMHSYSNEAYATLVVCSPARRMSQFTDEAGAMKWGYNLDINDDFYISYPIANKRFEASVIDGQYIYSDPIVLLDRRAKINVVVTCGALDAAYLSKLHFQNVITSAWYQPRDIIYSLPVMDAGEADPADAYTHNCYPESGDHTVHGNIMIAPEGQEIRLTKSAPVDEWERVQNNGKSVTAIRQFPLFAYEYGKIDPLTGNYVYESQIPRIVVYSGIGGGLKSTIRLAASLEPMTEYTVVVRLSTAAISADLIMSDWENVPVSVDYGISLPVDTEQVLAGSWDNVVVDPADGVISNPE